MIHTHWLSRGTIVLLALVTLFAKPTLADKPNVVYILSDNQSYYEMSCHGHADIKTPHIDRLAKQSLDFQRFYAPPFCSPSRSVILTGQHAMRAGVFTTIGGRSIMHRQRTTLPDILRKHGYGTGIFGKWHLGFSYPYRPQDRGFDEVFIHGGGIGQLEDYFGNTHFGPTFIHNGKITPSEKFSTDSLFDYAIDWVANQDGKPFFCFVSTPVTHSPHRGPKELVQQIKDSGVTGNVELYAQVQNLDMNIGRMLDKLDELGLSKSTIVIYASDQGMADRGAPHGDNRGGFAADSQHHVPFMVRLPGGKSGVNKRLAGMIDFFPTILDLCGIDIPDDADGISLKPLLTGNDEAYPKDRTLIIQCPRSRTAGKWKNASVKTDRWRLVNGTQLCDILVDPRQKKNVADQHPDVMKELRAKYDTFWESLPDQKDTLSRHLLGAAECPNVVLNGMDWYVGSSPWNSGAYRRGKGKKQNGAWAVTILKDGTYTFDLHHYPREANRPHGQSTAKLKIGDVMKETKTDPASNYARISLDLKAGDYDLKTWLGEGDFGALFVYVKADSLEN